MYHKRECTTFAGHRKYRGTGHTCHICDAPLHKNFLFRRSALKSTTRSSAPHHLYPCTSNTLNTIFFLILENVWTGGYVKNSYAHKQWDTGRKYNWLEINTRDVDMNLIYATQGNSYKNVAFKVKIIICIIQYSRGKQNSRHLLTWMTLFCTVMSNIFSKITALFSPNKHTWVSVHKHQVESAR